VGRTHVRQLWKAKLEGRALPPPAAPISLQRVAFAGRVLGIDPSLRATGLALLEFGTGSAAPRILKSVTVRVPARESAAEALASIHRAVTAMLALGTVRHAALEQSIFVQNHRTALILGSARGAAIAAVALQGIPVFEYPPLRVKEAVVGVGRASKEQVARTVRAHAGLDAILAWDEADAAAVALCHAFTYRE
jgi:crossover junction endodeoxyribonuclease RuvC